MPKHSGDKPADPALKSSNTITIADITRRSEAGSIVALTAYSKYMATLIDPYVDLILVGDSLGMVLYGMESTLEVSLDMMIAHGKAVMRGAQRACVVVDMPFGSYQASKKQAFTNAARLLQQTNAQAVKLEGGQVMAETIRFLVQRGIPVVGHIGLMPQYSKTMGGFKVQGRNAADQQQIYQDAMVLAESGVSAIVIEGTEASLSAKITQSVPVPTIGIGAAPECTGQILVAEDMLGLFTDYQPFFVKTYAHLADQVQQAVQSYAHDVRQQQFPQAHHCVDHHP